MRGPTGIFWTNLTNFSLWRPQLSVVGAAGLPTLAAAGNVMRPFTTLTLSMRIPPNGPGAPFTFPLESGLHGAFVWACRARDGPNRRFSARGSRAEEGRRQAEGGPRAGPHNYIFSVNCSIRGPLPTLFQTRPESNRPCQGSV